MSFVVKMISWLSKNSGGLVSQQWSQDAFYGIFAECCRGNIKNDDGVYQCQVCKRVFRPKGDTV